MRSDILSGGIFPDYELPDHTGKVRKLSELQGDDPLNLTLARGHYYPKEAAVAKLVEWARIHGQPWLGLHGARDP